ncbi:MAG: squalene/phytoene synthase family protein [Alphaproteobacteria bacterium]
MNKITLEKNFIEDLKKNYYELYIICLLLNKEYTEKLLTIISIFIEINSIPSKINDKMIGYVRFAWWREALENISDSKPNNHPLISKFSKFSDEIKIYFLKEIIDGCELELEEEIDEYNLNQIILKKYNSLLLLLENILEYNTAGEHENFANLSVAFFIIIEAIIKGNKKSLKNLKLLNRSNFNVKDRAYIEELINFAIKKIYITEKNYKFFKGDLLVNLIVTALKFYINHVQKNDFNISRLNINGFRFKLLIILFIKKIRIRLQF